MTLMYKEMMEKYNLHRYEAVAMEALASVTPFLMLKIPTDAIAAFVGAVVLGIAKEDKEKARELQLAYDELVKHAYKTLTTVIVAGIVELEEEKRKDKSDLH